MSQIPKLIHFCWLSDEPKPDKIRYCMQSWKKHLTGFEFAIWDTESFDINSVPFVKEACEAKKWAYACDYIRLYALYNHGGIYLDSDVLVHKSFEPFLAHSAFSSVEFHSHLFFDSIIEGRKGNDTDGLGIEAAVLGAVAGHPWIKACLDYYEGKHFTNTLEFMNSMILPGILASISEESFGFRFEPVFQILKDEVYLYPPDVFSRPGPDSVIKYSSHLCAHSWYPKDEELTDKNKSTDGREQDI